MSPFGKGGRPSILGRYLRNKNTKNKKAKRIPATKYFTNLDLTTRSAGPWPTDGDWRDIVVGDWKTEEWSVKN